MKQIRTRRISIESLALFVIASGCLVESNLWIWRLETRFFADGDSSESPARNLRSTNQRRPNGLGGGVGRGLGFGVPRGLGVGLGVGVVVGVAVAVAVAVGVAVAVAVAEAVAVGVAVGVGEAVGVGVGEAPCPPGNTLT